MLRTRIEKLMLPAAAVAAIALAVMTAHVGALDEQVAPDRPPKAGHVPEVRGLLSKLEVDKPRTHKNMVVFPIRWSGQQAPGRWETLDEAMAAKHLRVREKDQARVPEVVMENTGKYTVFLMSGEIVTGGKQTRVIRKDTIIEAKQKVTVPVLCVEKSRWRGNKELKGSRNMAPANIRAAMARGEGQQQVWSRVRGTSQATGVASETESLDEVLESDAVQDAHDDAHKDLGKFSPRTTVGIAVADARTGRVVGLEMFGRRDLFAALQEKLIEGYTTDLVICAGKWDKDKAKEVTQKDVKAFIARALDGRSKYEDTPGSGRGIDLASGKLRGKGVALGRHAIHLSIQDMRPEVVPARPIIEPRR